MNTSPRGLSFVQRIPAGRLSVGALVLGLALSGSPAQAAVFGHARLVSPAGQPFLALVPLSDLTPADLQVLSAAPAPMADWKSAGLQPPVALDSLSVTVLPAASDASRRVLQVHSDQPFDSALADLLLDVQSASGQQRYQVSLVSPASDTGRSVHLAAVQAAPVTDGSRPAQPAQAVSADTESILVRPGDNLFKISRHRIPEGATIYQLMMALQRTNPKAFIRDNVNLVRAGARLDMPSLAEILSISDAEARRQFMAHVAAFNQLRGKGAGAAMSMEAIDQALAGEISSAEDQHTAPQASASPAAGTGDRLRLTGPDSTEGAGGTSTTVRNTSSLAAGAAQQTAEESPSSAADPSAHGQTAARHGAPGQQDHPSQPGVSFSGRLAPDGVASVSSHDLAQTNGTPRSRADEASSFQAQVDEVSSSSSSSQAEASEISSPQPQTGAASTARSGVDSEPAAADASAAAVAPSSAVQHETSTSAAPAGADQDDRGAPSTSPVPPHGAVDSQSDTERQQALAEAQSRVSQLEDNIRNLDQALKSQGEAARSAVEQGVEALGNSLDQLAEAFDEGSKEAASEAASAADPSATVTAPAASSTSSDAPGSASDAMGSASDAPGSAPDAPPGLVPSTEAPGAADPAAAQASVRDAQLGDAPSGNDVSSDLPASAQGPSSDSDVAAGQSAQPAKTTGPDSASGVAAAVQTGPLASGTTAAGQTESPSASTAAPDDSTGIAVSWWRQHLMTILSGALAFLVLLIAWLLRRASKARERAALTARQTEALVGEKIRDINLDLK